MHRYSHWPIHLALSFVCALMLVPFLWVLKTSLTGENIFVYPPSLLPENPHLF
jgi:ABC-type glycerol-3-phosphate transport system permease component